MFDEATLELTKRVRKKSKSFNIIRNIIKSFEFW